MSNNKDEQEGWNLINELNLESGEVWGIMLERSLWKLSLEKKERKRGKKRFVACVNKLNC